MFPLPRPSQPPDRRPNRSSSSSPPSRYHLPSHLHSEVSEGLGRSLATTPDYASTAASSPSAACADLTLDGDKAADMSGVEVEVDGDRVRRSPGVMTNLPYLPASATTASGDLVPERSSSPAMKRPASELEEDDGERTSGVEEATKGAGSPLRVMSVPSVNSTQQQPGDPMDVTEGSGQDVQSQASLAAQSVEPTSESPDMSKDTGSETLKASVLALPGGNDPSPLDTSEASRAELSSGQGNASPSSQSTLRHEVLSVDEQIAKLTELSLQPLKEGDRGFVVSSRWVNGIKLKGSEKGEPGPCDSAALAADLGPVDNSDLVLKELGPYNDLKDEAGEPFVPLKPGLMMGEDFEIFPPEAWQLIVEWYSFAQQSPVITRFVHNTNPEADSGMENLQYEIYPPLFTVLRLRNERAEDSTQEIEEGPVYVLASRSEKFNHFLTRVKTVVGIPLASKVRVWRILGFPHQNNTRGMLTPAASRSTSPAPVPANTSLDRFKAKLSINLNVFLDLEDRTQREMLEIQDQTGNENYNGHMNLSLVGLNQDETIILEERLRGSAGGDWISEASKAATAVANIPVSVTKNGGTTVQSKSNAKSNPTNGRLNPPTTSGGIMTRGRVQKNGRTLGTCGLSNLGNTCYMNSALQCVRSVEELTQYFRLDKYKAELNPSNPLSCKGEVAQSYANLLDQMYASSSPGSVAPRAFKQTIGRHGPSFSGYGQQDSQEFLGFLLDGLGEDLNRIHKKPYIEKPDSTDEMVSNPDALRAHADRCWEIYKARNDSVIVDLFAGTYKSTLVCPDCEKVSITFDPFNNLTLQLPVDNTWSKEVFYFPLHEPPIRVGVEMDKHGTIRALKEFISSRVGVEPQRLHVAEIYKCKFYKAYDEISSVSEAIQHNDDVGVYELEAAPTNWPPPKKKPQKARPVYSPYGHSDEEDETPSWDPSLADKMLVPIFHRAPREPTSRFLSWTLFGVPSYVILTREEACDFDSILRKVLAVVDNMTTYDILRSDSSESSVSQEEDDTVVTTSEDADSSGESRVKAQSVEGEEDCVAVSIKDSGEATSQPDKPVEPMSQQIRARKNKGLQPGAFIAPELRNMFQMKIVRQAGEIVPTGWSANMEDDRNLITMESRIPSSPSESPSSETAEKSYMPGDEGSSESGEDRSRVDNHSFRVADTGTDSDSDQMPPVREILSRKKRRNSRSAYRAVRGAHRKGARLKQNYSRKGKRFGADSFEETTDQGPLLQLGEGIVLDWTIQAHSTLFRGNRASEEIRGSPTWEAIDLLPDEELKQRRVQRLSRRKKGVSLDDCLDEFGKEEILSENDAWYCPKCKALRRASKKFELWKAPDILVIHLKRFSASRALRDKIDLLVDFPVEGLDLKERVALKEEGKSTVYDLCAVDNHYGGLGGGHYTAMAKNFIDGNWYDYNDTMVSKRSPQQTVSNAAYLLFYRRRSDQPLGGPSFQKIIEEAYRQRDSPASSRTSSPAGDDQRLDTSSRGGSSSASQGVGAGRQEPTDLASGVAGITQDEEELPAYSKLYPGTGVPALTMTGTDNMDVDEGIDTSSLDQVVGPFSENPGWGFDNQPVINPILTAPQASPGSSDEEIMDGVSDKAADGSSGNLSDRSDRMADFADDDDDDGTLGDSFSNTMDPHSLSDSPFADMALGSDSDGLHVQAPAIRDDEDVEDEDGPVAEVHVEQEEGLSKSD